jgi:hypothetical protein
VLLLLLVGCWDGCRLLTVFVTATRQQVGMATGGNGQVGMAKGQHLADLAVY